MNDLSPQQIWRNKLENKEHKLKKKDVAKHVKQFVKSEEQKDDGYWIKGTNFMGNEVLIHCATREECYKNLATLNGVTIE